LSVSGYDILGKCNIAWYCGLNVIDRGITEVIKWRMVMQGLKVRGGNSLWHIAKPDHLEYD